MNYTQEQKNKIKGSVADGRIAAHFGKSKPKVKRDLERQRKATRKLRTATKKITKVRAEATEKRALANRLAREFKKAAANARFAEGAVNVSQKQKNIAQKKKTGANANVTAKRRKINGWKSVRSTRRRRQTQTVLGGVKKAARVATAPLRFASQVAGKTLNLIDPAGYGKALGKNFNPFKQK